MKANRKFRRDERGQLGIDTLIIFIAMVLIAAIAAAILINVTGELGGEVPNIARRNIATVATKMSVDSVYGKCRGPGSDEIEELYVTVSLGPDSGTIDLDKIVMEYTHSYAEEEGAVIYSTGATNAIDNDEEFEVKGIRGVDRDRLKDNLIEEGEVYKLTIDETGGLGLGEKATLKFIPEVGTPVVVDINVPGHLATQIVELYP